MKCQKYHKLISDYADNCLDSSYVDEVLEHIAECGECKRFYLNELKLKDYIKSSFSPTNVRVDVTASVMSKIGVKHVQKKSRFMYYVAGFAVFAFLGGTVAFFQGSYSNNSFANNDKSAIESGAEEKLQEFVLEHLDRTNINNFSTMTVSSVVYEK
ncbi:zf-HC2 domain-containing protein [Deferribacteraceae bacterium V6Fe1]|nr:zf-HC2 domain-containing protein [Deferribacteraceae bacterium V6Fe1]